MVKRLNMNGVFSFGYRNSLGGEVSSIVIRGVKYTGSRRSQGLVYCFKLDVTLKMELWTAIKITLGLALWKVTADDALPRPGLNILHPN